MFAFNCKSNTCCAGFVGDCSVSTDQTFDVWGGRFNMEIQILPVQSEEGKVYKILPDQSEKGKVFYLANQKRVKYSTCSIKKR